VSEAWRKLEAILRTQAHNKEHNNNAAEARTPCESRPEVSAMNAVSPRIPGNVVDRCSAALCGNAEDVAAECFFDQEQYAGWLEPRFMGRRLRNQITTPVTLSMATTIPVRQIAMRPEIPAICPLCKGY
jgi:hypothetical protein